VKISDIPQAMLLLIAPQLQANKQKYLNWKQGWRPNKNRDNSQKPNDNLTESKQKANVNVNDNDNVNENDNIYTHEFDIFRNTFPTKKWKQKAFINFKKALKITTADRIIEWAKKYAERIKATGNDKIKYPEWWLTDQRRDDELEIPNTNKPLII
jgi:hypothetical protein